MRLPTRQHMATRKFNNLAAHHKCPQLVVDQGIHSVAGDGGLPSETHGNRRDNLLRKIHSMRSTFNMRHKSRSSPTLRRIKTLTSLSNRTHAGGDVKFEYRHSDYWPALNKLAERRREAYRQRWIARGKKIGESEFYLRGGEERATTATTAPTGEQQLEEKLGNLTVDNDKPAETAPTAAAS
ncbi:hypothetical protein VTN31DRAFT_4402 [Thermomyces dupontii]|uniref:uncharacterized protein n=1 Tax=Talaromyces thermophilus TaxID=28565 RepID=UPI0037424BB8